MVIPLVYLIVFSMGVGLILAALTVKFRDIMHLYTVFFNWTYVFNTGNLSYEYVTWMGI